MAPDENVKLRNITALPAEKLRRVPRPENLPFDRATQAPPLEGTIGQPRAVRAIEFGMEVRAFGYNLYIAGVRGSGRETTVRAYIEKFAKGLPEPDDWVYVHNFDDPDYPKALRLPSAMGVRLVRDMDEFVRAARRQVPRAFDSDDYERRKREVIATLTQHKSSLIDELQAYAREQGFSLEIAPSGFVTVPLIDGEPITNAVFDELPTQSKDEIQAKNKAVQSKITTAVRGLRQIEKDAQDQVRTLDHEVAEFALDPLLEDLRDKYTDQPAVLTHISRMKEDILAHIVDFRGEKIQPGQENSENDENPFLPAGFRIEDHFQRYRINSFIADHRKAGAPVIVERNPSYYNLLGRINYRATFGAMATDFLQIKPGALHRANGGFLILHVEDLLRNPFAWDALKRALLSCEIRIENMGEQFTMLPTASLRPEPIPLNTKIILIGPPHVYQLLHRFDSEFEGLFKVRADFAPEMEWNLESLENYIAFMSRCVRSHGLHDFDRSAMARVIEFGARLVENQRKLSTRLAEISDLLTESSFWAQKSGHTLVAAEDVEHAIREKEYRSNLIEERIDELMADGTILIDGKGRTTGQVNGLAIIATGDHEFGKPTRITASVGLGRGNLTSVEREIKLSGPIHSKGFLILNGYLVKKYSQRTPLAVSATITFEQSYDEIEGDSASSTELYALLSALADVPLKQGIAVTGSVNQQGEIQAVGGVTRKIEGFFRFCKAEGLNGEQGVVIPAANAKSLMLDREVIEAVQAGKFKIWPITSIDEGLELLTDMPAVTMTREGVYPEGTFHRRVSDRLAEFAQITRSFGRPQEVPAGTDLKPVAPPKAA